MADQRRRCYAGLAEERRMNKARARRLTEADEIPSRLERFVDARIWSSRIFTTLLTLFAVSTMYFVWTVPLEATQQLIFACCCFAFALAFRRLRGQYATLVMIMLSVAGTRHCLFWRATRATYRESTHGARVGGLMVRA